ncbi:centromere protein U [Tiliqua scincoides]|uniref:centromere protein U n=1 Tax=Tiliqua scincoides TaxID=71010 RepID=UPI003462CA7D
MLLVHAGKGGGAEDRRGRERKPTVVPTVEREKAWLQEGDCNKMPKRKRKDSGKKLGKHQAKEQGRGKLFSRGEPDLSSILTIPGTGQAEEPDEFDHPLHSTAVSDLEEEDEGKDQCSEPDGSIHKSSDSELEKNNRVRRKNQHGLKLDVERKDSEEEAVKENMMPRTNAKSPVQQNEGSSPVTENSDSDDDSPRLRKIWGPKGMKKVASRITESDVILDEFEKITSKYKQGVESKIYRKTIDSFYIGFRDQLTSTITDAEELKHVKSKNVKMVRATNKKRQRLIEIKEELIRTEPQLKKLQREYADLKGRLSSLRNAVRLVTDLEELQQKFVRDKNKNPQGKIIYGASSVPALLVESRRILGVESDFQNIESKLQQMLDLQEEK